MSISPELILTSLRPDAHASKRLVAARGGDGADRSLRLRRAALGRLGTAERTGYHRSAGRGGRWFVCCGRFLFSYSSARAPGELTFRQGREWMQHRSGAAPTPM